MRIWINIFLFVLFIGLSIKFSWWFLLIVFWYAFNTLRVYQIGKLKQIRDSADFTTEWGKALIKACNERINLLNFGSFRTKY